MIFLFTKNEIFGITEKGEVFDSKSGINIVQNNQGLFSAIEKTQSALVAVNDMSSMIRVIDINSLQNISTIEIFGQPKGLSCFSQTESCVIIEDLNLLLADFRLQVPVLRSNLLGSPFSCVSTYNTMIFAATEDRKIRIFDSRKIESSVLSTKPASKVVIGAIHVVDDKTVVCLSEDSQISLIELESKVGQFKRKKYFTESPLISAPFIHEGTFNVLTNHGYFHSFTDITSFLRETSQT